MRTGWNDNETVLNATNVASTNFGLLSTISVDGLVMAQPLYVSQYQVPNNGGTHNLLVVATEHNSLYAIDANTGTTVWQRNFGASEIQNSSNITCGDITPEIGITGTPVIARTGPGAGAIYVIAATEPTSGAYHSTLFSVDIGTGQNLKTPVEIKPSALMSNGSTINFDPKRQMERTALVWANNSLYAGFGSHCDSGKTSTTGWMLRYDANLNLINQFNTVDDSGGDELASIWMGGYGSAVDASGNVYFVTGNGGWDLTTTGGKNYAMSALKLSPTLTPISWFTPANVSSLNDPNDQDFGSGGAMLIPGTGDLVAMGKDPKIYLLNTANLGGFSSTNAGALQVYTESGTNAVWGGPALYSPSVGITYVYYQIDHAPLQQFTFNGSALSLTKTSTAGNAGYGGSDPIVTSNGQTAGTAVVWLVKRGTTVSLEAYNATDVTKRLFSGAAGTWTNSSGNAFISPLVVDGRAYVGAASTVKVYGLINPAAIGALSTTRGTKTVAQTLPKTIDATILRTATPRPSHALHIQGFVVSHTASKLTLRRRDGTFATVDITEAVRNDATGMMPVNRAVTLYGYRGADRIFHVTSIGHSSQTPSDWGPDTGG